MTIWKMTSSAIQSSRICYPAWMWHLRSDLAVVSLFCPEDLDYPAKTEYVWLAVLLPLVHNENCSQVDAKRELSKAVDVVIVRIFWY